MPTTYTGSPVLNTSITIPLDGDNANAASVNSGFQSLTNMQNFLLQGYGQAMQSTSPIRIFPPTVSSITIAPIPVITVSEGGTWKTIFTTATATVNATNIEGGGVFAPSTWYYVYAYSVAGVVNWQLSLSVPDQYGLYKNGTFSHKYIGAFKTDGSSFIIPFQKYGEFVNYCTAQSVTSGSSLTPATLATSAYIPNLAVPTTSIVRLLITMNNLTGNAATLTLRSYPTSLGYTFNAPTGTLTNLFVDVPTNEMHELQYFVSLTSLVCDFKVYGYYE